MLKLVWFSDLHLGPPGTPRAVAVEARLAACVTHARRAHADADLCVVTGDIADQGGQEEYARLPLAGLGRWPLLLATPGNHDDAAILALTLNLPGMLWPFSRVVGGFRLVFLDTHLAGQDGGRVGPQALDWLAGECVAATEPLLVFLHHQPGRTFVPSADTIGLADRAAFEDLLRRHHDRIAHLFFGHCHLPISGSLCGIGFTGLPATAFQQALNLADRRFIPDMQAPPAYGVVLAEGDDVAVHFVQPRLEHLLIRGNRPVADNDTPDSNG